MRITLEIIVRLYALMCLSSVIYYMLILLKAFVMCNCHVYNFCKITSLTPLSVAT